MATPWLDILTTFALCYTAWGVFYFFLYRNGVDYTRRWGWTAGYFFAVALAIGLPFSGELAQVLTVVAWTPLLVLGGFMLAQVALHVYFPKLVSEPAEYLSQHPERYYLRIDLRRLFSKSFDILAQQVFIVLFVVFLSNAGLAPYQILVVFGALFALLHIPLLASEWGRWPAWAFGGAVLVFSIIFPVLILTVPYGFVYNIIIHWLFYTGMATAFWIWHEQKEILLLKARVARAAAVVGLCIAALVGWALWAEAYGLSIALLVATILLMEVRVRMGYTLPRGPLFYIHVASGALLMGALVWLTFGNSLAWAPHVAFALFFAMLTSGAVLLWRNLAVHG